MSFRILIAEKDIEMAAIIASEIQAESPEIILIQDGRKIFQELKTDRPQLLIMDWVLPELCGFSLLSEIRALKKPSELSILLLCDAMDDELLSKAIEAGVNDYLYKPYQRAQLVTHVRALKQRLLGKDQPMLKEGVYEFGKFRLNLNSSDFYQGDVRTHLTPSEFKLLEALFHHRGTILTRDQLIAKVQGAGVAVIDRAIDTHVFALRKKLGEFSDLIETVRGVGYRIK